MAKIEILMVHSVDSYPNKYLDYLNASISASDLDQAIEQRKDSEKWSLKVLNRFLNGKRASNKQVLILTFDDGYKSFMTEALPIIEKHQMPVVLFVTTDFASGILPYEIQLAHMVENSAKVITPDGEIDLSCENRMAVYTKLKNSIKRANPKTRRLKMDELLYLNRIWKGNQPVDLFLSWEEIVKLSKHPLVTIGSHCMSHCLLKFQTSQLPPPEGGGLRF
jgi:peptidoglycan/xylan/chitin deacetylase (PgdA/CDA1 family)